MASPQALLARLDAIGQSVAATGQALALIGLGSVGQELHRLDQYSDLDFFVITPAANKPNFIADLAWLAAAAPLAYVFRNTADGYKVLAADGIFYEFAVFEPRELRDIPMVGGRIVWRAPGAEEPVLTPGNEPRPPETPPLEWLVGEALTNLYVGLGRYHRGEKLSAMRFIQQYAVDRVLQLAAYLEEQRGGSVDPFAPDRRYEDRYPLVARELPQFIQGYARSRESARAILDFLARHCEIEPALAVAIRARY